jgi:DNA repair exonuclease SbcCD ATPase subunit
MKEQIYALKNKLAVTEDHLTRSKSSLKEVGRLQGEVAALSESLKTKDFRIEQLEEELAEADCLIREHEDRHRVSDQTWQTPEASELDFYKDKVEELTAELDSLQTQMQQTERLGDRVRSEGGDVGQQLLRKEESLRAANKRFQMQQKRLDTLELSVKQLEARNKLLEADRRKFLEKWQSTVSRTKGDEKLKAKLKEQESSLVESRNEVGSLQAEKKQLLKKLQDREAEHQAEVEKFSKVIEGFQKIKLQQRLDEDDRQILENMNKELSVKLSVAETELERHKEQLQLSKGALSQTANLTERRRVDKRESLTSLIEKLARESEKPLLSLKHADDEDVGLKRTQHPSLRSLSRMRRAQTPNTYEQRVKH